MDELKHFTPIDEGFYWQCHTSSLGFIDTKNMPVRCLFIGVYSPGCHEKRSQEWLIWLIIVWDERF